MSCRYTAMKSGALIALIAWQLVLTESIREIQSFSSDPDSLSNIQLLIPLLVSEPSVQSELDDRGLEARVDYDKPFRVAAPRSLYLGSADGSADSSTDGSAGSSADNGADGSADDGGELWRACKRMARAHAGAAHDVLLYLCAELLDVAALDVAAPCACCRQDSDTDPPWFGPVRGRRYLVPLGDHASMVERYIYRRRKPKPWWVGEIRESDSAILKNI